MQDVYSKGVFASSSAASSGSSGGPPSQHISGSMHFSPSEIQFFTSVSSAALHVPFALVLLPFFHSELAPRAHEALGSHAEALALPQVQVHAREALHEVPAHAAGVGLKLQSLESAAQANYYEQLVTSDWWRWSAVLLSGVFYHYQSISSYALLQHISPVTYRFISFSSMHCTCNVLEAYM